MSRALDDREQAEYLKKWEAEKRKKDKKRELIRKAYKDGAINFLEMQIMLRHINRRDK